jgi:hypothetical protein
LFHGLRLKLFTVADPVYGQASQAPIGSDFEKLRERLPQVVVTHDLAGTTKKSAPVPHGNRLERNLEWIGNSLWKSNLQVKRTEIKGLVATINTGIQRLRNDATRIYTKIYAELSQK